MTGIRNDPSVVGPHRVAGERRTSRNAAPEGQLMTRFRRQIQPPAVFDRGGTACSAGSPHAERDQRRARSAPVPGSLSNAACCSPGGGCKASGSGMGRAAVPAPRGRRGCRGIGEALLLPRPEQTSSPFTWPGTASSAACTATVARNRSQSASSRKPNSGRAHRIGPEQDRLSYPTSDPCSIMTTRRAARAPQPPQCAEPRGGLRAGERQLRP